MAKVFVPPKAKPASASSPCANAPKFWAARSKFPHSPQVAPSFISKPPANRWNLMPNKLTVLLVDDHALVRRGFRRILEDEPFLQVVGEASDGLEAVQLAEQLHRSHSPHSRNISRYRDPYAQHAFRRHAHPPISRSRRPRLHPEKRHGSRPRRCHPKNCRGQNSSRSANYARRQPQGRTRHRPDPARTRNPSAHRRRQIQQANRRRAQPERQHRLRPSRQYHGRARHPQNRGTCRLRHPQRSGDSSVKRRDFLKQSFGAGILSAGFPFSPPTNTLAFQFADVTAQAGINFNHNSGAYGGKLLPETLGSGCAFLDYDADGWPDILLINCMDWPGHKRQRSTLKLFRNNRNGTFTDVTKSAGLDVELYGMGVAVADYDNDGFPDIFISCVGQSRLFHNNGN